MARLLESATNRSVHFYLHVLILTRVDTLDAYVTGLHVEIHRLHMCSLCWHVRKSVIAQSNRVLDLTLMVDVMATRERDDEPVAVTFDTDLHTRINHE